MIIHFIDLDHSLFDSGQDYALISKNQPEKSLLSIPRDEYTLMQRQSAKHSHPISYNGNKLWLSDATLQALHRAQPGLALAQVGISNRFSANTIDSVRVGQIIKQFSFLKNRADKVVFFTSKAKETFKNSILKLREEFSTKLGASIVMVYYLNEFDLFSAKSERRVEREERILLEYLLGKKVKKNQFVEEPQVLCEQAYYYSGSRAKVEAVKSLQQVFDRFVENTNTELYNQMYERVRSSELTYSTHLITGNELNPFLNQKKTLLPSRRIRAFQQFKNQG